MISLLTSPLRLLERARYAKRVQGFAPEAPPIFVVGFWRSGTTYLHNLFTCDRQLGYVTQFQTMAPELFLSDRGLLRNDLTRRLADERPQDGVKLAIDTPQEEEFALACATARSMYHGLLYFPRFLRQDLSASVLFDSVTGPELQSWRREYRRILAKASLNMGGKRLVLKNPPNLARIRVLMAEFPQAKFVHIYRNPFEVIPSLVHTLTTLRRMFALQDVAERTMLDDIFYLYERMFERYFDDVSNVPPGNLAEVRFDDLERDPLREMARLYDTLHIDGFTEAETHIRTFVAGQRSYRKNVYRQTLAFEAEIAKHCAFTLRRWGYTPPPSFQAAAASAGRS